MKTRILSTIGLWTGVIVMLTVLGNPGGVILLVVLSGLTQWELYTLLEKMGRSPMKVYGVVLGTLMLLGSYYLSHNSGVDAFVIAVIALSVTVLRKPDFDKVFLPTLFGLVYIPFMFQFYGLLLNEYQTLFLPVWVIAVAKFSDVGGLLIGKQFGKTKLAPQLSPGKTVEGAAGGILTSVVIGSVLALFFLQGNTLGFGLLKAGFSAACIGAVAIISDLIESAIKRQAGVKDSGNVIPGIGGAFDLSDSLILTAPVGYLLITYLN